MSAQETLAKVEVSFSAKSPRSPDSFTTPGEHLFTDTRFEAAHDSIGYRRSVESGDNVGSEPNQNGPETPASAKCQAETLVPHAFTISSCLEWVQIL